MPFVSVVVITKNNAKTIEKCLVSLLNQSYPKDKYEIIFVDGHSADETDKIIQEYMENHPILKLHYEKVGKMGYARNLGVSKSRGEIIVFTDGDASAPRDWLEKIVSAFDSSRPLAVGGLDLLDSNDQSGKIIDSWRRLKRTNGVKAIPCIKTVNFAISRDAIVRCGGFDPMLSHWDEAELLARLYSKTGASSILYDPEIIVYHGRSGSISIKRRIRKVFRKSVTGTPVLMRRYMMKVAMASPTSSLGTSFLIILACIIGFPLLLFSIAGGFFNSLFVFALSLYAIVLGVFIIAMYRRAKASTLRIPLFLTIDFVARLAGSILGLLNWLASIIRRHY